MGDYEPIFDPILGKNRAKDIFTGSGLLSINGLTPVAQLLVSASAGSDFNIVSSGATHTFNLPTASALNRGALSSADWSLFNSKLSVETDPIFIASPAFGIGSNDITNWNTAYGWGDHSVEGYLKNIVEDKTPQLGDDLDTNSNDIKFLDNDKAIFGTVLGAEIYSDGNDLIIRQLTQDRDIKFYINDGGLDTVAATIEGSSTNWRIGSGSPSANYKLTLDGLLEIQNAGSSGFSIYNTTASWKSVFNAGGVGNARLISNWDLITGMQDNASFPTWSSVLSVSSDYWALQRSPAGSSSLSNIFQVTTSAVNLFENDLNNVGNITHDDATASDWILKNADQDKDTIFNVNVGGVDTTFFKGIGSTGYAHVTSRLGIGILNPETQFHILEETLPANFFVETLNPTAGNSARGAFTRGRGTKASPQAILSGDEIGRLAYNGHYGTTGAVISGIQFRIEATENWSVTNRGAKLGIRGVVTGTSALREWIELNEGSIRLKQISGCAGCGAQIFEEKDTTPANPTAGTEVKMYMKDDKIIFQYDDAGTVRYKYLDLTGVGVTWQHSTTAP